MNIVARTVRQVSEDERSETADVALVVRGLGFGSVRLEGLHPGNRLSVDFFVQRVEFASPRPGGHGVWDVEDFY